MHTVDLEKVLFLQRQIRSLHGVDFVKHQQLGNVLGPDFLEHLLHLADLQHMVRVGRVHHVHQQIGVNGFLQGCLKGINQTVRQITDKAHRVRQGHRALCLAQIQLARGGVQRGKQLVCGIGARLDQGIEQGGLARVGVTNERNVEGAAPVALLALGLMLALDLLQLLFGALDGGGDHAPVQLNLRLAGAAARADAAALALQMRPAAYQARAEVLQAREFDLQLAFVATRALGKYFQNQKSAVIDRQLQAPL